MNNKVNFLIADTQAVVFEINELIGSNYSVAKIGPCWFVLTGDNNCMNGAWTEETLQRMYDQTNGFLQAVLMLKMQIKEAKK